MITTVLSWTALALGSLVALCNWYTIYDSRRSRRFVSSVPLVGSMLLVAGLLGFDNTRPYAWVGIIADYGTIVFILASPKLISEAWSTSRFCLIHEFTCQQDGRRDSIRLFKRSRFVIRREFDAPVEHDSGSCKSDGFALVGEWQETESGFLLDGYDGDKTLEIIPCSTGYAVKETVSREEQDCPSHSFDGLIFQRTK